MEPMTTEQPAGAYPAGAGVPAPGAMAPGTTGPGAVATGAAGARPASAGGPAGPNAAGIDSASIGELFGRLTEDFSTLMRQEVELAKAEIKQEATKAGKGAGLLGGTGIAGLYVLTMLSFAAAWGLAAAIPTGWAFLIVAFIWGVVAAAMFVIGRKELRRVHPVPEQTVETLKEDVQWAKHPKS